jgi:hypothetical protein
LHGDVLPLKNKVKAAGIDPEASGLVIIEIPLNLSPDVDWLQCFSYTTTWTPSVHLPRLSGSLIEFRAMKEKPERDLEWVYKYIDQANDCYRKRMKEKEEEGRRHEKIRIDGVEDLRDMTERLRQVGKSEDKPA